MTKKPEGFHALTPMFVFKNCRDAMALYEKALNAETLMVMDGPEGKVMHAEMNIGDSKIMVNDEFDFMPRKAPAEGTISNTAMYLYVDDCDAAHKQALENGFIEGSAPESMFWGDRTSVVTDPYGYVWTFSQLEKELTPEEVDKARAEAGF